MLFLRFINYTYGQADASPAPGAVAEEADVAVNADVDDVEQAVEARLFALFPLLAAGLDARQKTLFAALADHVADEELEELVH